MTRLFSFLILFLALTVLPASAAPYRAPQPPAQTGGFMPIAAEIGQQLQELVGGETALDIEPQDTFGTRALGVLLGSLKVLGGAGAAFFDDFAALSQMQTWILQQFDDPVLSARWVNIGVLLGAVLLSAFAAAWLADLVLLSLRRKIRAAVFVSAAARFGAIVGWLGLSLVPVVLFIGAALAVIDAQEPTKLARYIVMTVVYALALFRLVRLLARFFLAPRAPSLRFLPIADATAQSAERWMTGFGAVMIAGFFTAEIAKTVKIPIAAISGFTNLVALVVVSMAIALILRKKTAVSTFVRGNLSTAQAHASVIGGLRLWLARTWHVLAILYLVVGYVVTMLGAGGGFALMQQGTVGTLLSLLGVRLAFYGINRALHGKGAGGGAVYAGLYRPVLRALFKASAWGLALAGVALSWDFDVFAAASSPWGQRVLGSLFSIVSTLLIVVFAYELLHAAIGRKLNKRDAQGRLVQANARARTILPMVQKTATILLAVIVGLVTLSELGVNIAPLLAGAGILGVAVGFGSQTLVKDFLTGLFIIIEDDLAVGDWVMIGGNKGVVENLSIRTVRLRDVNGALHIMPFSAISVITNESKLFSYALMDVGVSYDSDLNRVMEVIRAVGAAMQADAAFKDDILEPIEVMGVEALGDSSVLIRSRIKTRAGNHSPIRRAFLLRIKKAFDAEKIEIPFPTVKHVKVD